jgi:hypothetical protein
MPRIRKKALDAAREARLLTVSANLLAGLSYRQIASALGVSWSTVKNDSDILFSRWREEQAKNIQDKIDLDLRQIDMVHNAIWGKVLEGDNQSIDRFCALMDRRMKLQGTAAPQKVAPTNPEGDKPYDPLAGVDDATFSNLAALLAQYGQLEGYVERGEETAYNPGQV